MKFAVLSYHGLGGALALDLVQKGKEVFFIDLSSLLSKRFPSELKGPFGYFNLHSLKDTHKHYLQTQGYMEKIFEDFVIWDQFHPYLLSNSFSHFYEEKKDQSFKSQWRFLLASNLFEVIYDNDHINFDVKEDHFKKDYSCLKLKKDFLNLSHEYLKNQGIKVISLSDCSFEFEKNELKQIKSNDFSLKVDVCFNFLTSSMMKKIDEKAFLYLYPKGEISPEFFWSYQKIHLKKQNSLKQIPHQAILVKNPYLPWVSDNILWLETKTDEIFHLWFRAHKSLKNDPLLQKDLFSKIQTHFSQKIAFFPLQDDKNLKDLSCKLEDLSLFFPIYEKKELLKLKERKMRNLFSYSLEKKKNYLFEYEQTKKMSLDLEMDLKKIESLERKTK